MQVGTALKVVKLHLLLSFPPLANYYRLQYGIHISNGYTTGISLMEILETQQ